MTKAISGGKELSVVLMNRVKCDEGTPISGTNAHGKKDQNVHPSTSHLAAASLPPHTALEEPEGKTVGRT